MKKIILPLSTMIFCFLFSLTTVSAQSSANYTIENLTNGTLFTDRNGNAIDSTGKPNLIFNWVTNQISALQPIGFDLAFMGKYYSHFIVGSNGQMALASPTYLPIFYLPMKTMT